MAALDLGKVIGSKIHNVTGTPAASLGLEDDWALNTTTGEVWQRTASGWVSQGSFKGPKGDAGATGAAGADGKTPMLSIDDSGHLIATYPD